MLKVHDEQEVEKEEKTVKLPFVKPATVDNLKVRWGTDDESMIIKKKARRAVSNMDVAIKPEDPLIPEFKDEGDSRDDNIPEDVLTE